jgi:ACS family hexuronate transporter-like MFS transporter
MRAMRGTSPGNRAASAWPLAIVAALTMSVSYVDRQTLAAISPAVTAAFGIDETHYGWLIGSFSIAYLVFAPLSGAAVDRLGARWGMAAALVVWSVLAGLHALGTSFGALFAMRFLLGAAESPAFPSSAQAIRRALPGAGRPLAIGILFTGGSIGALVAAKLAIAIEGAYGFRGAFVGTAVIGALWLPVWLIATAGHGLERGVTRPPEEAAVSLLAVLRDPPVLRAVVAIVGVAPGLMFVLNWTAKYLVGPWSVPRPATANYLAACAIFYDLGAVGFGWLQLRREKHAAIAAGGGVDAAPKPTHRGLVLGAMGLAAVIALTPLMRSPWTAVLALAVSAFGGGGIYTLVTTDALDRVPASRASRAGGLCAAAQSIAYVVAGPLVGFAIDVTHGYTVALVGLGIFTLPTCLAFAFWPGISVAPRGAA